MGTKHCGEEMIRRKWLWTGITEVPCRRRGLDEVPRTSPGQWNQPFPKKWYMPGRKQLKIEPLGGWNRIEKYAGLKKLWSEETRAEDVTNVSRLR
jgi:hypothetical protein